VFIEKITGDSTHAIDIDLRHLVLFSLRYSMWGEVPSPRNPNDIRFDGTYPFLHIRGRGLRIHSTVSDVLIARIFDTAGVVYFGCLH